MSTERVTESGMTLELPKGAYFRFAATDTYETLKGCGIKEMDFAFFREDLGCMLLVELTHYTKEGRPPVKDELKREMTTKARDSLLLLQAAWRAHGAGRSLAAEMPLSCRSESRLRVIFVVKLSPEHGAALDSTALSNMGGQLKRDISPIAGLLGLNLGRNDIYLCDETEAMKLLSLTVAAAS